MIPNGCFHFTGMVFRCLIDCSYGLMDYFKPILDLAQDYKANGTVFWPTDEALKHMSEMLCMPVPNIMNTLKASPSVAADIIKQWIVPNVTVMSNCFQDGMQLQSFKRTSPLTIISKTDE